MTTIGLVGAGHMGAGLGWALREGGDTVVTTLDGRSARTAALVERAGSTLLPGPRRRGPRGAQSSWWSRRPSAARRRRLAIAEAAGRTGATPLVADLNAVAPSTMDAVAVTLADADSTQWTDRSPGRHRTSRRAPGSTSPARGRPRSPDSPGGTSRRSSSATGSAQASAVKMCTASVYKGLTGILTQALRAASALRRGRPCAGRPRHERLLPGQRSRVSATKAWRFVGGDAGDRGDPAGGRAARRAVRGDGGRVRGAGRHRAGAGATPNRSNPD